MNEAHKLYNMVAVPKITYATNLWYHPKKSPHSNCKPTGFGPANLTKHLESIQCQAAISITGGLHTSPGDTLIVHSNLVLIKVQLKEICLKTYACLSTCATTHLIANALHCTAKTQVKTHHTALHHLAKSSDFNPANIEKIRPTCLCPGEYPDFVSSIVDTKEAAITTDKAQFSRGKRIYTDGSGYKEQVGALAMLFTNGKKTAVLCYRLGLLTEHMVFEGKLVGIILGFHLTQSINSPCTCINFSINNQATIKTLDGNEPQGPNI